MFVRQHTALQTMVDDWDEMAVEERRRALSLVFERIVVGADGVTELDPYAE